MGWLKESRNDVNSSLTSHIESIEVHPYMPERVVPPAAVILPGNPFTEDGQVFGDVAVRWQIILVPLTGTNETMTDDLLGFIEDAVTGLIEDGYTVEQVGQPYMLAANNANYLAANATVVGVSRP